MPASAYFTSRQVCRILGGGVTQARLQHWDKYGLFRPSFYRDRQTGRLIPASAHSVQPGSGNRRNPARLYTYEDLLWLRLYLNIIDRLRTAEGLKRPYAPAANLLRRLRELFGPTCPSAKRLLFHAGHVYLLGGEHGLSECLVHPGELAWASFISTEALHAEIAGRVEVLREVEGRREAEKRRPRRRARP